MYKITASNYSNNFLFKIKHNERTYIIWIFGPIGVLKFIIKADFIINSYNLITFCFNKYYVQNIKHSLSYLTSVGHWLKLGLLIICKGYTCYVRVKGVGYKIDYNNSSELTVILGYSHKIVISLPYYIKICILKKRILL